MSIPQYSSELFQLIDNNRIFLQHWLAWLDNVKAESDTEKFLAFQLLKFQQGKGLHETIFYQNQIAGVVGYNEIDHDNNIGYVGYWLAKEYNGKGIMTQSVKDLIAVGFEYYDLEKIDIRCAVDNSKSLAIPTRLGFKEEGIIRHAEKLPKGYVDHLIYGLLKNEL